MGGLKFENPKSVSHHFDIGLSLVISTMNRNPSKTEIDLARVISIKDRSLSHRQNDNNTVNNLRKEIKISYQKSIPNIDNFCG
jgi:predicted lysophospholipase L1 biosynthesis ABC-type transport system permease subunit